MKLFGVSQEGLGFQVDKRQTTISNWLNGNGSPDVEDLIKLNQFFGISIDILVLSDIEKGNLITNEDVAYFKQKGNLKGKAIGNLNGKNQPVYYSSQPAQTVLNEGEENMIWAVLSTLRQMDGKLDQVRAGVDEIRKKKT